MRLCAQSKYDIGVSQTLLLISSYFQTTQTDFTRLGWTHQPSRSAQLSRIDVSACGARPGHPVGIVCVISWYPGSLSSQCCREQLDFSDFINMHALFLDPDCVFPLGQTVCPLNRVLCACMSSNTFLLVSFFFVTEIIFRHLYSIRLCNPRVSARGFKAAVFAHLSSNAKKENANLRVYADFTTTCTFLYLFMQTIMILCKITCRNLGIV